jgi:hypothetical protein
MNIDGPYFPATVLFWTGYLGLTINMDAFDDFKTKLCAFAASH